MIQTAEERTRLLAERVGFAMTAFAMIETQLDFLFAASVSLPINISARMLASVKNFSTTLEVIDVAVRHKLKGSGALPYWLSLLEYVRELSGDRNYLAHTPMINHMPATGTFPIDPQQAQPLLGPPMSAFLGVIARRPPFDANEILEIIRDFEEAVTPGGLASIAKPGECRALVESDMVGLGAFDLILRNVRARVMDIAFVPDGASMYTDDRATDAPCLRIPAHTIANVEAFHHDYPVRCSAGFTVKSSRDCY